MQSPDGKTILLIEDNVISQITLTKMLRNMGFKHVECVNSSETALEKLKKLTIDLIIMDIFIKGNENGIELTHRIKSIYSIPVLYITASSDKSTYQEAFLKKPYDYYEIEKTISDLIL